MDTAPHPDDRNPAEALETSGNRPRRVAGKAARIAEADAAACRLIEEADIDSWIDSIGTHHELPPRSGH